MSDALAKQIVDDAESSPGLAWFVRALLAIGAERLEGAAQLNLLEMLQSMLGSTGQHPELLGALEEVKRGLPQYAEVMAEREAAYTPPDGDDPEAAKHAAAMQLLGPGATDARGREVRALLERLSDPNTSREDRHRLQGQLNDLVLKSRRGQ